MIFLVQAVLDMAPRPSRSKKNTAATDTAVASGTTCAAHAERAADCELELIQLFLAHKKSEIARRRLHQLCDAFPETTAAAEAVRLLETLSSSASASTSFTALLDRAPDSARINGS